MRVLTAEQMQEVDAETIAAGTAGLELMERAGRGVADLVRARFPAGRAAIFVGPGNNGGDGLVVARLLIASGWSCSIHLVKPGASCTPDTAANYSRLSGLPQLHEADATSDNIHDATLIIDSIFGTGFSGVPRDRAAGMISLINRTRAERRVPVVSIDIPSGVNGTTGEVGGDAVQADITVTIGVPKTGLLFHPGRSHVGELNVIDIGFPRKIVEKHAGRVLFLDRAAAAAKLPPRAPDIHKYKAGTVLVIAGSARYRGAALLTAEAALRAGCGMVYLAVPESIHGEIPMSLREAIVIPLPQTGEGTIALEALNVLVPHIQKADAVAIGPGMGRHDDTDVFVRELVTGCPKPMVVDADALNAIAGHVEVLSKAEAHVIITPHDGELARLTGDQVPTAALERIAYGRAVARRFGVTLVHKGAPTLVAGADGEVWINGSGSSALAKGGTGDVLTGLIAGFLASAPAQPLDAACVACFLHGRAAEIEAGHRGQRGVLASDLFLAVGRAMTELETS